MKRKNIETIDLSKSARADDEPVAEDIQPVIEAPRQAQDEPVELPGFEWSTLIDDLVIPAAVIEQALWNADVTEPEHVFTKPADVTGAFLTVLRKAMGDLKLKVRSMK
jgi:hypothetical protein